jgi:hypothetical protein
MSAILIFSRGINVVITCKTYKTPIVVTGVGTGGGGVIKGAKAPQVFKSALNFSGGKVPFAFVKNVVQIAFLPQWPLIYDCGFFIPKVPLETGAFP